MPKVKKEVLDEIRTALKEDRGKVARAIKICREKHVSSKVFGGLLGEGLTTTFDTSNPIVWLYGYRVDGVKYKGKVMHREDYLFDKKIDEALWAAKVRKEREINESRKSKASN